VQFERHYTEEHGGRERDASRLYESGYKQGRIKGEGNGGNCPGPSVPRGPPVMTFVLNKTFV